MTKILIHNQAVRSKSWSDDTFARVWTLRGDCVEANRDYDEALARSNQYGHELVATISLGAAIVGDKSLGARMLAERRAIASNAVVLADCCGSRFAGCAAKSCFGNRMGCDARRYREPSGGQRGKGRHRKGNAL
jgi:hypothetical protein